jgi:hypothetical protein
MSPARAKPSPPIVNIGRTIEPAPLGELYAVLSTWKGARLKEPTPLCPNVAVPATNNLPRVMAPEAADTGRPTPERESVGRVKPPRAPTVPVKENMGSVTLPEQCKVCVLLLPDISNDGRVNAPSTNVIAPDTPTIDIRGRYTTPSALIGAPYY